MKGTNKAYTLLLIALLTLSAYFLADTVDAVIGRSLDAAPLAVSPLDRQAAAIEPKKELSDYTSVLERGLFGDGKAPSAGSVAAAASSYRLIGTVEGESFAGAVLEDTTGQVFYRIHQKLPDGSQIVKVQRDSVTLKNADGSMVELQTSDDTKIVNTAKPGGGIRQVANDKFVVDQQTITASTENLNQILTQARALPYQEQGKTVGFRMSEIVPGSIYEQMGLKNGDVVEKINSQDVDDPAKFFQMYQGLKEEKSISIDVVRNGQRQTLNYEVR